MFFSSESGNFARIKTHDKMIRLTYEQYLQLCEEQEEAEKHKRPAHRPEEVLFLDNIDKTKVVNAIKLVIKRLSNIDGSRFTVGKHHFGKSRFWAFIYIAMVENEIIKQGNNVVHYYDFIVENFDHRYLVDRKHLSDIIHSLTREDSDVAPFIYINKVEDIKSIGHLTTSEKSLVLACMGTRALFSEEFSKKI